MDWGDGASISRSSPLSWDAVIQLVGNLGGPLNMLIYKTFGLPQFHVTFTCPLCLNGLKKEKQSLEYSLYKQKKKKTHKTLFSPDSGGRSHDPARCAEPVLLNGWRNQRSALAHSPHNVHFLPFRSRICSECRPAPRPLCPGFSCSRWPYASC